MESLKEIIQESIAVAKAAGLWQRLSLREKGTLARYFRHEFGALPALTEEKGTPVKVRTGISNH